MKFQIVNQILSKSFSGGKDFCPNSGDKNEILHFETFSKLWREIENIFLFPKKKNLIEIYFEKVHP